MNDTSIPAAVSTGIARLLRGPEQEALVLAAFPHAVYLAVGAQALVGIVTADGVHQPNAAVLRLAAAQRPFARLHAGQAATIGGQRLRIGGLEVRVSRWWNPRPRLGHVDAAVLRGRAAEVAARVRAVAGETPPALSGPLAAVTTALLAGDQDRARTAADRLIGAGPGLTPAGDDVLAGLISGSLLLAPAVLPVSRSAALVEHAAQVGAAIAAVARERTTTVSAALLRHAADAEVAAPAAVLLHGLAGRGRIASATDGLLAIGSTSGRDLAVGLLAAADLVAAHDEHSLSTARTVSHSQRTS